MDTTTKLLVGLLCAAMLGLGLAVMNIRLDKWIKLLTGRLLLWTIPIREVWLDFCVALGEAQNLAESDPALAQELSSLQNQLL